ncbi:MAG TPA: hypothetical protein VLR26_16405 [Frankiaceae bacterium]|nr:hypothetical protein [Frankiaceae bacterium]
MRADLRLRGEHLDAGTAAQWIGGLFAVGSLCFLVGPIPGFVVLVGERADGLVFFVGSLFFTSAAAWQWFRSDRSTWRIPGPRLRFARRRWRTDRGSSTLQLAGTIFFNATTFWALTTATGSGSYDRLVWRPDAFGSVCFLASGWIAYVLVSGRLMCRPPRTSDGRIALVNLLGCVAFLLSALAGYVLPTSGEPVNVALVNATTSLGALGFLGGALLLARDGRNLRRASRDARQG